MTGVEADLEIKGIRARVFEGENPETIFNISFFSFLIIGIGGLACVISGYLSQKNGAKKIAFISLLLSCIRCLISPYIINNGSEVLFLGFLLFWGMVVIADSPLLSTLVAQNTLAENKGTALTIVNCIGFLITIISIQCITYLISITNSNGIYIVLAIGPILGLIALKRKHHNFKSTENEKN